jgi:hypothetical protein
MLCSYHAFYEHLHLQFVTAEHYHRAGYARTIRNIVFTVTKRREYMMFLLHRYSDEDLCYSVV